MGKRLKILTNGIIKENPVLVLLLGTCPTLATTSMAINGLGMGVAATVVLMCSNLAISLLKKIIPDKVRIPCYIVVIAGFVTVVQFLVKAFAQDLDKALGIFLPLIVVNCIILCRAEMFASKNGPVESGLALTLIGSVREILGAGTWMSGTPFMVDLTGILSTPMSIFTLAPGGFFVFGCMIALINKLTKGKAIKKKEFGCANCPNASSCGAAKGGC